MKVIALQLLLVFSHHSKMTSNLPVLQGSRWQDKIPEPEPPTTHENFSLSNWPIESEPLTNHENFLLSNWTLEPKPPANHENFSLSNWTTQPSIEHLWMFLRAIHVSKFAGVVIAFWSRNAFVIIYWVQWNHDCWTTCIRNSSVSEHN